MVRRSTHLDAAGKVRMVDVSRKRRTTRTAVAEGFISGPAVVVRSVARGVLGKGDALAAARVAGIAAVKKTADIIPLCHPVAVTHAAVDMEIEEDRIRVVCRVRARDATGVEMEALTGVAAACLTIYDMAKSLHKGLEIGPIRLLEKTGGRSGRYAGPGPGKP